MKRFRQDYPRTYPFAVSAMAATVGWGIGAAASRTPSPWGLVVVFAFCLTGMAMAAHELRGARRRLAVLQQLQRAIEAEDLRAAEAAMLDLKILAPTAKRRHRQK
jgi:hypothetical protein